MWALLTKLNKNLVLAIPFMMLAGFAFGAIVETGFLKSLIIPFTFLMVYPMMVTLKLKKVLEGGDGKAQLLTQLINFAVVPFFAYGLSRFFFADRPYMALGLLLAALVPTSGMTISWTGFAKGNLEAAVKMTVVGLILGSLATPFYVRWLLGAHVAVDTMAVMKQIAFIVFLPLKKRTIPPYHYTVHRPMKRNKKRQISLFAMLARSCILTVLLFFYDIMNVYGLQETKT